MRWPWHRAGSTQPPVIEPAAVVPDDLTIANEVLSLLSDHKLSPALALNILLMCFGQVLVSHTKPESWRNTILRAARILLGYAEIARGAPFPEPTKVPTTAQIALEDLFLATGTATEGMIKQ